MVTPADLNITNKPFRADEPGTWEALQDAQYTLVAQRHLPLWVVTYSPTDFPGLYVARLNIAAASGTAYVASLAVTGSTLESVRQVLPAGLVRMSRADADEPQIVETWL